jgi:hypothetical protein
LKRYPAATRYEAAKRISVKREKIECFAQVLRSKWKLLFFKLENERALVLGGCQPRFTLYTDEESVCSLQSGLGTRVCASCNHKNEMQS